MKEKNMYEETLYETKLRINEELIYLDTDIEVLDKEIDNLSQQIVQNTNIDTDYFSYKIGILKSEKKELINKQFELEVYNTI